MSDLFRIDQIELSESTKEKITTVKQKAAELVDLIEKIEQNELHPAGVRVSRELSLAKTKLEEFVMWAVKDLTAS